MFRTKGTLNSWPHVHSSYRDPLRRAKQPIVMCQKQSKHFCFFFRRRCFKTHMLVLASAQHVFIESSTVKKLTTSFRCIGGNQNFW